MAYQNSTASIIMPNFNKVDYIEEAINSVINQSWDDWELLVVDNKSDDQSCDIIRKMGDKDKRIKPVFLDRRHNNAGLVRNVGIEKAKGRFLAFLDSDDLWQREKLEKQISYVTFLNAGLCTTHTEIIDLQDKIIGEYSPHLKSVGWKQMLGENYVSTSATLIDRNIVNCKKFMAYKHCQDYAYWMDIVRDTGEVHILQDKLTKYRIDPQFYVMKKFVKAYYRWRVHREHLKCPLSETIIDFMRYTYSGFIKSRKYRNMDSIPVRGIESFRMTKGRDHGL